MEAEELIQLVSSAGSSSTWKISRRDLGFISGMVMHATWRLGTLSDGTRACLVGSLTAERLLQVR
jgi:hypothetical protein